jgi:hypothetical protein
MEMSRVVFYCDDRKVGQVLRILAGVALQTPEVTPVVNAQQKNGKLEQRTSGKASVMLAAHLRKHKKKTFGSEDIREFLVSIGRSEKSRGTVLQHMFDEKLAKRVGQGTYQLI